MKNVSKNRFLACFRPVVDIDSITMLDSGSPVRRRSASCHFADKHDTRNSSTESISADQECLKSAQNHVVRQPSKRALAKVIKAVVFETILSSRARNKKLYSQTCFGSKRSYSAHAESSSTGNGKSTTSLASLDSNIKEINPMELSFSSSPSSSRALECNSSEDQLEKQNKCICPGIYMVLICLAVTVLCGKINIIILTLVLFCFFPVWNASCHRLKEVAKLWKTDSNASKNREHSGKGRTGCERNFSNGH